MDKKNFAFDKVNFILLAVGMVVIILGFILMSGSGSTEKYDYITDNYSCHCRGTDGIPAGIIYRTHDHHSESSGYREYAFREGVYRHYSVWCDIIGRRVILEEIL